MVDIRIVCARDAVKTAETLRRLLEAEPNAPGAHYMFEWAARFDRKRTIEVASASGWPELKRAAPVIDFVGWNGTRGSKAWVALNERLRPFSRVREIKPPPRQAFMALGMAAAAAMVGAVVVRVNAGSAVLPTPEPQRDALHVSAGDGVGGPLEATPADAVEPASIEDTMLIIPPHFAPMPQIHVAPIGPLADLPELKHIVLRQPTLLERLEDLNPLQFVQRPTDTANE